MSGMNEFMEKREFPRLMVKLPLKFRILVESGNTEEKVEKYKGLTAETLNLSRGGMYISTEERKLNIGSILSFDLFLPELPKPLASLAEAVRVDGKGVGLRFLVMRENDTEALGHFLRKGLAVGQG